MRQHLIALLARVSRVLRHTPLARSVVLNRVQARIAVALFGRHEARVGPFSIAFHPGDRVLSKRLILYGGHESAELSVALSYLRAGDTALDVGANVGIYSLHFARAVGPSGKVIAVEPDPENVRLLQTNVQRNNASNVVIEAVALGRAAGRARLFRSSFHHARSSLIEDRDHEQFVDVKVETGESMLQRHAVTPRLVKIDVEGVEPDVFAGLGCLPAVIVFEFVPRQLRIAGHEPSRFLQALADAGYDLRLIQPANGRLTSASPAELERMVRDSRHAHNVLGIHRAAAVAEDAPERGLQRAAKPSP